MHLICPDSAIHDASRAMEALAADLFPDGYGTCSRCGFHAPKWGFIVRVGDDGARVLCGPCSVSEPCKVKAADTSMMGELARCFAKHLDELIVEHLKEG